MKYGWILIVLAGCAEQMGVEVPEARLEQALAGWHAHGLPQGWCGMERPYTVSLRNPLLVAQCHPPAGLEIRGCFQFDNYGDPAIFLEQEADLEPHESWDRYLEHELRHWMGTCSSLGGDANHQDARYWYDLPAQAQK